MASVQSRLLRPILKAFTALVPYHQPIPMQRLWSEQAARFMFRPGSDTGICQTEMGGVACEWIEPLKTTGQGLVIYFHGGGYCTGSPNTHRRLAADLARSAGLRILLPDYRLAPEHPFPAALDDALRVYRAVLQDIGPSARIVLSGDSAGGGLIIALCVALRDRGEPLPSGLGFISPWLDLTCSGATMQTQAGQDPVLSAAVLLNFAAAYAGDQNPASPLISPLFADLHGLPPVLIQVGSDEILRSDSEQLAEKLKRADVAVTLEIWPHMWHVFPVYAPIMPEGRQAVERMGSFLGKCIESTPGEKDNVSLHRS